MELDWTVSFDPDGEIKQEKIFGICRRTYDENRKTSRNK